MDDGLVVNAICQNFEIPMCKERHGCQRQFNMPMDCARLIGSIFSHEYSKTVQFAYFQMPVPLLKTFIFYLTASLVPFVRVKKLEKAKKAIQKFYDVNNFATKKFLDESERPCWMVF